MIPMRVLLQTLVWAALLVSCKEVSFKEPQPSGVPPLTEIPEELRGHYLSIDEITGEESDTLIIESWGYHFKDSEDNDWLGRGTLSDSLIVKFHENYYFINFRSGDQWVLRLIRKQPFGAIDFLSIDIQDDAKRKELLKKMSRKIEVREIHRDEDTFYQINPTPAQLMELIKSGYFTGPRLSKIN